MFPHSFKTLVGPRLQDQTNSLNIFCHSLVLFTLAQSVEKNDKLVVDILESKLLPSRFKNHIQLSSGHGAMVK